jgi:hypothetical protein
MRGYITEENFEECEEEFPGIVDFYRCLAVKPRTFLELMHAYLCRGETRRRGFDRVSCF